MPLPDAAAHNHHLTNPASSSIMLQNSDIPHSLNTESLMQGNYMLPATASPSSVLSPPSIGKYFSYCIQIFMQLN
jgi:hypothetical protein